jgi:hypothetical protein
MILIAHRGNINGPSNDENEPKLIMDTLVQGFQVEVDVWFQDGKFILGHDSPTYEVPDFFLEQAGLWCHAKNIDALVALQELGVKHYFWHQEDDYTLTSSGYIWTYPGKVLTELSIAVMPETIMNVADLPLNIAGVCSDYVGVLK